MDVAEMLAARAKAVDGAVALAALDTLNEAQEAEYKAFTTDAKKLGDQIERKRETTALALKTAKPVGAKTVPASAENDAYVKDKSLVLGGMIKMIGAGKGSIHNARHESADIYGEEHPVTKALLTGVATGGGFLVPPDIMSDLIPLLRAQAVVRSAGPIEMSMPRGTMTLPGQGSAATASYGAESAPIKVSQPGFNSIVASYKKLTALVPVSNDMVRYANPTIDGIVRADLVKVMALREDLAFLLGDGMQDTPRGYISFANGYVAAKGGTVGVFSQSANSVFAVNAADPPNSTGGNFITSTSAYTLQTAVQELGGAINRLDTANVPDSKRVWFMHPRPYNYLMNVQNALGVYVFRDQLVAGNLLGYPVKKTTQIGNAFWDATGTNKDLTFIMLVEMTEDMVLDSMQLELAVSSEASYVDTLGATISTFQNDQMLIRAIAEHDHQMRHDNSLAIIQAVRWAPAIS